MCAMVALVAAPDLKIPPLRVTKFLDAYLGKVVCTLDEGNLDSRLQTYRNPRKTPSSSLRCLHPEIL